MHLPDIFVVKPIFVRRRAGGLSPARIAHHTDVGGRVAGSNATRLDRDLPGGAAHAAASSCTGAARRTRRSSPSSRRTCACPTRCSATCTRRSPRADIGERGFLELVERYGAATLRRYTRRAARLQRAAGARPRSPALPDGDYTFTDYIDDDGIDPGPVTIAVASRSPATAIHVDFAGTSPQVKGAHQLDRSPSPGRRSTRAVRCILDPAIPNNGRLLPPDHGDARPPAQLVNPVAAGARCAARG